MIAEKVAVAGWEGAGEGSKDRFIFQSQNYGGRGGGGAVDSVRQRSSIDHEEKILQEQLQS